MIDSALNTALSNLLDEGHTHSELRLYKYLCEAAYVDYVRIMFRLMYGFRFRLNWHHELICKSIEAVFNGDVKRLIINCPPGYGKTELCVRMLLSYVLAKWPTARSMHLSSSAELAWLSSRETQDIVRSPFFQLCWPTTIRGDIQAKRVWRTTKGGGLVAGSTRGQIIGFRAGRLEEGFGGLLVIDDPIKPEDSIFDTLRDRVNRVFQNTIKSRLARQEHTPIIIIMQRIHDNDLSGFLLRGGSGEKWRHLLVPSEFEDTKLEYPHKEYSYGVPIEYEIPCKGPLWPWKESQEALDTLRAADDMVYSAQHLQQPTQHTGEIFKSTWWPYYNSYDPVSACIIDADGNRVKLLYKNIYGDTAMKAGERNDWTVFQCWALGYNGKIYLLDQYRARLETPDLETAFEDFCGLHEYKRGVVNLGVRSRYIEDKSSGIGLIQALNRKHSGRYIQGMPRDKDKVSRAKSGAPEIYKGNVVLPRGFPWVVGFIYEHTKFSSTMAHKHDDQVDCTLDAIYGMLQTRSFEYKDVV